MILSGNHCLGEETLNQASLRQPSGPRGRDGQRKERKNAPGFSQKPEGWRTWPSPKPCVLLNPLNSVSPRLIKMVLCKLRDEKQLL